MIYAYTDTSLKNTKCVVTYTILDESHFYAFDSSVLSDIPNSTIGEYTAIKLAMDAIVKLGLPETTQITFLSDSREAINLVRQGTGPYNKEVQDFLAPRRHYVGLEVCASHLCFHNPNKVCDLTCNSILRYVT